MARAGRRPAKNLHDTGRSVALVSMVPGRRSRRPLSSSAEGDSGRLPQVHGWHGLYYHPAPSRSVNLHGIFLAIQSSHIGGSIHALCTTGSLVVSPSTGRQP